MNHWNFRLIDMSAANGGEPWVTIKEVYYEDDKPVGYADVTVGGESADEIKEDLLRMFAACGSPMLAVDADDNLMTVPQGDDHAKI